MRTWTAETWTTERPGAVMARLTDPREIARWSPLDFVPVGLADGERLGAGTHLGVRGALAGRSLLFRVDVLVCDATCLAVVASGPFELEVEWLVCPRDNGSEVSAAITVSGTGMLGRILAHGAEALLAAGVLDQAMARVCATAGARSPAPKRTPVRV